MDLRTLTESIAAQAQAPAPAEQAQALAADLHAALPPAPFTGALAAGSFHVDLAAAFGTPLGTSAAGSVKLPFTVALQPSFNPRG